VNGDAGSARRGRVLVVDDEESIRFTFRSFLEEEGHETLTAKSYDDAVDLIREEEFDLIYIDIILEGKSGMDLLMDFKKTAPDTEVIIITGAPTVETASNALRLGATDYIVKPIRQETLLHTTDMALRHRALRMAKEAYRINLEAIFRSVRDAIITVDEEMILVEANPAAGELCGIWRDEDSGQSLLSLETPCSGPCFRAMEETVSNRERIDLSFVECSSELKPDQVVSVTTTPLLKLDGSSSGGVMVIRDETRLVELERSLAESRELGKIVGNSQGIRNVLSMIQALSDVRTSVLVTGESGTGKELVADALHTTGNRRKKNLVKVNCAALSDELLESELFGHVRGAFTGAIKDKIGRFQRADGGTLFLDEIGEMSPRMQTRFLRVLETMEFERVGDSSPITVDVRVVAATNCDLNTKIEEGEFREDLFFRLKVFEVTLPPLRERMEDVPLLVQHFLVKLNRKLSKNIQAVSDSVMELFMTYHWPGNVRQLENILEYAFVLARQRVITAGNLPADFMKSAGSRLPSDPLDPDTEVRAIHEALRQTSFNKSEAARLLGISRRTLYRKLARHKIQV